MHRAISFSRCSSKLRQPYALRTTSKNKHMLLSMFVSVCQVPVAEGKSVQQTVDILHQKLEQLGAVKQGSFCVDCETYHATGNVTGNFHCQTCCSKTNVAYIGGISPKVSLVSMSTFCCTGLFRQNFFNRFIFPSKTFCFIYIISG